MTIRYIIHLARGECRCFSERDLEVNLRFALKEYGRIVRVEARCKGKPKRSTGFSF